MIRITCTIWTLMNAARYLIFVCLLRLSLTIFQLLGRLKPTISIMNGGDISPIFVRHSKTN